MPVGSNQQAFFNHESIESYELSTAISLFHSACSAHQLALTS